AACAAIAAHARQKVARADGGKADTAGDVEAARAAAAAAGLDQYGRGSGARRHDVARHMSRGRAAVTALAAAAADADPGVPGGRLGRRQARRDREAAMSAAAALGLDHDRTRTVAGGRRRDKGV